MSEHPLASFSYTSCALAIDWSGPEEASPFIRSQEDNQEAVKCSQPLAMAPNDPRLQKERASASENPVETVGNFCVPLLQHLCLSLITLL